MQKLLQYLWRVVVMLITSLLTKVCFWRLLGKQNKPELELEVDAYVEPDTYANTDMDTGSNFDPYVESDPYVEVDTYSNADAVDATADTEASNDTDSLLRLLASARRQCNYKRVGFIVKERTDLNHDSVHNATGLHTSSGLTAAGFRKLGVPAEVYEAHDGNSIDGIIKRNHLDVVVLEANWALPTKIAELRRLHPNVSWFVRIHSEIPFLAHEGIAWTYMQDYDALGVTILPNDPRTVWDLAGCIEHLDLLRNTYAVSEDIRFQKPVESDTIDIGCFGAIRSLKNHMRAACAAIRYANHVGKKLRFHINAERVEGGFVAANTLKNLRALLGASLVGHGWLAQGDFINIVCRSCSVVLVPSLSETFNVVAADAVMAGVPVVTSNEVPWLKHIFDFAPNDPQAFYAALEYVMDHPAESWEQQVKALQHWNADVIGEYEVLARRYFRK